MKKLSKMQKTVRARFIKQQNMRARNLLKSTYSVFILEYTESPELYNFDGERVLIGETLAHAVNDHACKWSVSMVLATRESNGKNKLTIYDSQSPQQCKFSAIVGSVADSLVSIGEEYPWPEQIITLGWVATLDGQEVDEDLLYQIYDEQGVWSAYDKTVR